MRVCALFTVCTYSVHTRVNCMLVRAVIPIGASSRSPPQPERWKQTRGTCGKKIETDGNVPCWHMIGRKRSRRFTITTMLCKLLHSHWPPFTFLFYSYSAPIFPPNHCAKLRFASSKWNLVTTSQYTKLRILYVIHHPWPNGASPPRHRDILPP